MKIPMALKLDFKIDEEGKLRIFDLGDGLAADNAGFEELPLVATLLKDLQETNNSALATLFGELPQYAMQPETMHLPIIQRQLDPTRSWRDISDLVESGCSSVLTYSAAARLHSPTSSFWSYKSAAVKSVPMGLIGMEMHKILWYSLMQKHLPKEFKDKVLYWSNDDAQVELDLSKLNMSNGVFIKFGDRSTGGGGEVYYAKDAAELKQVLSDLHQLYRRSKEEHKKHLFVIEPAYQTIKEHQGKNYNVTGRTFLTLIWDTETRKLDVKVAGAKWIFPLHALQKTKTQEQMLANLKHSVAMQALNKEELALLRQQIATVYGEVFAASMEHEDLITYCKEDPIVEQFKAILRPNASYKLMLDSKKMSRQQQDGFFQALINSLILTHYLLVDPASLLNLNEQTPTLFSAKPQDKHLLINRICYLSFLEAYAKFVKTCDEAYKVHPKVVPVLRYESLITLKLDALIKQFLALKSPNYDQKDLNRALRQAASVSDLEAMKLLIGTHRASVHDCSPKTQQTALDFALKSVDSSGAKELCIQLLKLNGANALQSEELDTSRRMAQG